MSSLIQTLRALIARPGFKLLFAVSLISIAIAGGCVPQEDRTSSDQATSDPVLASGITSISDQYHDAVMADHPDGYWRLGESDVSEGVQDETSFSRTGTYLSSAIVGVPGPMLLEVSDYTLPTGSGILGTSPLLQLPSAVSIPADTNSALEFWVNISSSFSTGSVAIVSWGNGSTNLTYDATSHMLSATVTDALAQSTVLPFDFSQDLDQWVHLVWILSPTSGGVQRLYLNGQSVAQIALPPGGVPALTDLTLGGGATDPQAYFSVSELALFSDVNIPTVASWLSRFHLAGY